MNPNQPYAPPPGNNPYEFITNPGQAPKKPLLNLGNSMASRLLVVLGGVFVLILLLVFVMNLLSGGGSNTAQLKSLAAEQQELIRIAAIGVQKAPDSETKGFAYTTQLSLATDQASLRELLADKGTKISEKDLVTSKDTAIDQTLETAASGNNFSSVFTEAIKSRLSTYLNSLNTAHTGSSDEEIKAALTSSYESASNLIGP